MLENLPFPSRWLAPLWLVLLSVALNGQTYKVESGKAITIDIAGVTAAFSLDSSCADASAESGVVTVSGKFHGTTHVMVVTAAGAQPVEIVVTDPPVKLRPGFRDLFTLASGIENGYSESRYDSTSNRVQSQVDFSRRHDQTTLHAHLGGTRLLGDPDGRSRTALSSAYYQISTPRRDITILDQYLTGSPLGINGSIVRGVHFRQDGWFLHAGYSSVSSFEGVFLPTHAEGVIEAGYRHPLTEHSSLTGTFDHFAVPSSDTVGRGGNVALLSYAYSPGENFVLNADVGFSRGLAGAARLDYRGGGNTIRGSIRFAPSTFASLGANNQKGFHSDFSWTRQLTGKLSSDVTFYNNTLALPGVHQTTTTAGAKLQYRLGDHWSVFGGATGSAYASSLPPRPPVRNLGAPAGLGFHSRHFGAQGQYQFTETSHQESGSHQFRASVNAGAGPISISAFGEQQTQAPTLSFVLSQTPGLQQALDLLGIEATSIEQVDELLREHSDLFAAGYILAASVNLAPLRRQVGSTFNWNGHGRWPQVSYNFLYNDVHGLTSSTVSAIHSLAYTQKLGSEQISLSYSIFGMRLPGQTFLYQPSLSAAWRHEFHGVPSFIIPEPHGAISGLVFRDDNGKGTYEPDMSPISGAKVVLDDSRRVDTGADGSFRFARVPAGKHRLVVSYRPEKPIFFSTQSDVEVTENSKINFGIGFSLSSLMGRISNDAGQGVMGVTVIVKNKVKQWKTTTHGDGSFLLRQFAEGEYQVEIEEDSLPAGYLTSELAAQNVQVGAATPGNAVFSVRALRSIAGRVLAFDRAASKEVPVADKSVALKELAKTSTTDKLGRYIFRDLPAGSYTVAVASGSKEVTRSVTLTSAPSTLTNTDLQIGEEAVTKYVAPTPPSPNRVLPKEVVPPTAPVRPTTQNSPEPKPAPKPVPSKVTPPRRSNEKGPDVSAAEHDRIGRQKMGAWQYTEAIAELSEAIRLAPDFALAYNARGFARYKLYQLTGALEDLDKAIALNPDYANAYHNRAVVRKAAGDLSGAAADSRRESMILEAAKPGAEPSSRSKAIR